MSAANTALDVLPAPTEDPERAERDLRTHAICAVTGVLDDATLSTMRSDLYVAATHDRRRGWEQHDFVLDPDSTNQRVWNVLSRSPVFIDLVEHPVALRLLRAVLDWPMLLGNISGNITGPGGAAGVLHADQLFVPDPWPAAPQELNATWCVDDFTADNGATCFVPGSHLLNRPARSPRSATPSGTRRPQGRSSCSTAAYGIGPAPTPHLIDTEQQSSRGTCTPSSGPRRTGSCRSTQPFASSPPTSSSSCSATRPGAGGLVNGVSPA
jgi:hypothetical protein